MTEPARSGSTRLSILQMGTVEARAELARNGIDHGKYTDEEIMQMLRVAGFVGDLLVTYAHSRGRKPAA